MMTFLLDSRNSQHTSISSDIHHHRQLHGDAANFRDFSASDTVTNWPYIAPFGPWFDFDTVQTSYSRNQLKSEQMQLGFSTTSRAENTKLPQQQDYRPRSIDNDQISPLEYLQASNAHFNQPFRTPDDSAFAQQPTHSYWSLQTGTIDNSVMGTVGVTPIEGLKRQRSHQRTPSAASTITSNGPASPYNYNSGNIQIANTDFAPFDYSGSSKDTVATHNPAYLSPGYPAGRIANFIGMKGVAAYNDQQNLDLPTEITAKPSMTESDSSLTPGSVVPEESENNEIGNQGIAGENGQSMSDENLGSQDDAEQHHHRPAPSVQLFRTESAAYQDELYNPSTPTTAAKPSHGKTSSPHQPSALRTLVNQRLETANMARSASPTSAVSRERSPFREGSHFAASEGWSSPRNPLVSTTRRQQIKEERERAEYAAHRPQLQREPTKTISPKDAVLDYNDQDQPSLFQDTVPVGYQQHLGGEDNSNSTEAFTNPYIAQPNSAAEVAAYAMLAAANGQTNLPGFRSSTSADGFVPSFNFSPPASQIANTTSAPAVSTAGTATSTSTMQNPYLANYQQVNGMPNGYQNTSSLLEPNPEFPATLTSMESSLSDQGLGLSSQDSLTVSRPADTRAATGTYTCTYHGCTQRFESPTALQRHKRDFHRSHQQQQAHRETLSAETSSASPRSTESPGPISSAGLTSAQILARNSQAGPHKCLRINPSTGKPCNTVFSRPYDLTRHEDTIHNNRKQKVRCPYCREEKTFSRNDALTRHMRVVHPDVDNYGKRGRRDD